jgi:DNA mismatch repair protein MutS2
MNDLIEKSLQILELPEVLKLLAAEAVCAEAKERSLHIRPSGERGEAERLLLETDAACRLMQLQGAPQFSGVRPVGEAVRRAQIGGMLNTRELLNVAGVLKAARLTREYGSEDRKEPLEIDWLFRSLQGNRFLEDKIFGAIVAEDEISSSASPELFDIRRHMQNAVSKVREVLQQIISSPHYQKYLQETIITMRNERYVVPVKAECKGEVPGLIHDVSASGATVFIEPMKAVQANNDLRELAAKEKKEIERILAELSALIAEHADAILRDYDLLVRLDCIFARAKLSGRMNAISPVLSSDGSMNLRRARHPLLPSGSVVPIDVHLGGEFDTLVITGPNTGGMGVTLKTIGLLSLMAQCGLHIPAGEGSTVAPFSKILADIGDEQSIEQSLSTFSAHISNIIRFLRSPTKRLLY